MVTRSPRKISKKFICFTVFLSPKYPNIHGIIILTKYMSSRLVGVLKVFGIINMGKDNS